MLPAFVVSIRNVLDLAAEGALDLLGEFAKVVGVRFFECVADCWQIFSEDSLVRSCSAATERARVHRLQDWNELSDDPGETMAFCGLSVGARVARPCAAMWLKGQEEERYRAGERIFELPTNAAKVRVQ
jgi:hypothetical protein